MKRIVLRGDYLPGGKPEFPPYCVVCDRACDSGMFMPVRVSGAAGAINDLFRVGRGHFVPVHKGTACGRRVEHEYFRDRRLPMLLIFSWLLILSFLGYRFGLHDRRVFYVFIGWLPVLAMHAWVTRDNAPAFEARVAMNDWGKGQLVCEFENEKYAARFSEANDAALAAHDAREFA